MRCDPMSRVSWPARGQLEGVVQTDYQRPLKTFQTTIAQSLGLHFYRAT